VVKIKTFCLTFDIEEFDIARGISEEEMNSVSAEGTKRILKLLKEENVKATFFITSRFAQKNPKLVIEIGKDHEIGSHGYEHSQEYKNMDEDEAYQFIKKSKEELEKIIKKQVKGFRAPRMMKTNPKIVRKAGFKYDSSYQPSFVPGRYLDVLGKRKIHYKSGIAIVPTSVTPWWFGRIPLMWYGFRKFGSMYTVPITWFSAINNSYLNIYFHSWEFVDISKYDIVERIKSGTAKVIKKNSGEQFENMLRKYIRWCKRKYNFKTISEMLTQEVPL
jgi:peptidoglycan/xylan/chitin deacetylase (PgdA/CDA1 family)